MLLAVYTCIYKVKVTLIMWKKSVCVFTCAGWKCSPGWSTCYLPLHCLTILFDSIKVLPLTAYRNVYVKVLTSLNVPTNSISVVRLLTHEIMRCKM